LPVKSFKEITDNEISVPADGSYIFEIGMYCGNITTPDFEKGEYLYINRAKLEEGEEQTPWAPALEESSYITTLASLTANNFYKLQLAYKDNNN
jgi:hypothetical protein